MDILVLLLLFALYVIPEVLRRTRKPKTYKYPEFPTSDPQTGSSPTANSEREPQPIRIRTQPVVTMPAAPVTAKTTEAMPAQPTPVTLLPPADEPVVFGNLAYGLVMAEILGPPRSLANQGWKRR
jgi:hypothetical protein